MRMYLDQTVLDAAKERLHWLFEEFETVVVNVSGGKDSTVVFELAYEVAQERDDWPLHAFWMDQEFEYMATVDVVTEQFERDGVEPLWTQMPKRLPNPFSQADGGYMVGWNPEREAHWIREKDPRAVHENRYIDEPWHFEEPFGEILSREFDPQTTCSVGGVRTEESPLRYLGVTQHATYKGVTWGTENWGGMPAFYPIYDWSYSDEWAYIHQNDIPYHPVYDFQYQKGVGVNQMRCGNLNSELATGQVERLQEFEPDTWDKFVQRWPEVQQAQSDVLGYLPDEVPDHFSDWREYRNYLLPKMVDTAAHRQVLKREFFNHDLLAEHLDQTYEGLCRAHVRAILKNDVTSGEVLDNAKQGVAYPRNARIKKAKKEWLREHGYWPVLRDEGVVGEGVNAKAYDETETGD